MKHQCCPPEWRATENVTGDHVFDESLARSKNSDMRARLEMYTIPSTGFGPRTGYNGYHNYGGDS